MELLVQWVHLQHLTLVFVFKEGCEVSSIEEVDPVAEDIKLASYPYVRLEKIKVRVQLHKCLGKCSRDFWYFICLYFSRFSCLIFYVSTFQQNISSAKCNVTNDLLTGR